MSTTLFAPDTDPQLENFVAGSYHDHGDYASFVPSPINRDWHWEDTDLDQLLERANYALKLLDETTRQIPNCEQYLPMFILKEAQASSEIEGIKMRIEDLLLDSDELGLFMMVFDWQEVHNYVDATTFALKKLKNLPLSNRLLKEAHAILLRGERGKNKRPGEIRTSQNWIGGPTPAKAKFVPPHHGVVVELLAELEKFWHNDDIAVPHLVRLAVSHYQFETIHPFLDGNGRIGRLLFTLYLHHHGLLNQPVLYLSTYILHNQQRYYAGLTRARTENDLKQWLQFVLHGIETTALHAGKVLDQITQLRSDIDQDIANYGKDLALAQRALKALFRRPIITAAQLAKSLAVSQTTATKLIEQLLASRILEEPNEQDGTKIYGFVRYLRLFSRG